MNIVTVIPIAKGIIKDYLSYFTSKNIPAGSLIKIPLRNKTVSGIVFSCEKAENLKTEIRQATFETKKIEDAKPQQCLSAYFLDTINKLTTFYITSPGSLIYSLIPQTILQSINKIEPGQPAIIRKKSSEKLIIQRDINERLSAYRSLVREEFAKKMSVYIVVPTTEDALFISKELSKGVEQYSYTLGSFLSKQKLIKAWNGIVTEKHPVLIIGTGHFLALPRNDINTIIVEKENSPFYKTIQRPYLDIRKVAETFAETHGTKILYGDSLLSVETMSRFNQSELTEISPLQLRLAHKAQHVIVDQRTVPESISSNIKHDHTKALSKDVLALITHAEEQKQRVFIFANRRGISPSTYCSDCGAQVVCHTCSSPVVLYERGQNNSFVCHKCGSIRSAKETCTRCESWNLNTYGTGADKIYKEIIAVLPNAHILQIDSDHTKTRREIIKNIDDFYNDPKSILIGTDLALHYLHQPFEHSIVPTIDSMFSIPDFKANEKILSTLGQISALTQNFVLIQTRMPDNPIFSYIQSGNISEFYRDEINERKKWGYPPFFTFIKVTLVGNKEQAQNIFNPIQELLTPYESDIFTSSILDTKGRALTHLLIRIPKDKWPDAKVVTLLKTLPPECSIKINPDQIM